MVVMGPGAVPGDGGIIIDAIGQAGRQVRVLRLPVRPAVAWVTDEKVHLAGLRWALSRYVGWFPARTLMAEWRWPSAVSSWASSER